MKILLNLCCAASVAGFLAIAASDLGIPVPVGVARKTDGSVARETSHRPALKATFAAPVVFNAHAQSKVVQYFDTYRSDSLGLPPACAARTQVNEMPIAWGNAGIASGTVIPESERSFLVDVPVELVRVLAAQSEIEVRYYLAGRQLVAVDSDYKVLESVAIPTVRLRDGKELVGRNQGVQLVGNVRRGGR